MTNNIPSHLVSLFADVQARIKQAEEVGLNCPRCGGAGIANFEYWRVVKLTDKRGKSHSGKVCFQCNGAGRLLIAKKQRASLMTISLAIWKRFTSSSEEKTVINFGSLVNFIRTEGCSSWQVALRPLVIHLFKVMLVKAIRNEDGFVFEEDDMCWDPRCYSFFPIAKEHFGDFHPSLLDSIRSGEFDPVEYRPISWEDREDCDLPTNQDCLDRWADCQSEFI